MNMKSHQTIAIAFFIAAALIGLPVYRRFGGPMPVSEVTLYVAAAILCVMPVIYRLLRCKMRRKQA